MANLILMPQLGISEESAILTQWHVKQGDAVKAGQNLFSIETGKSSFDVQSEHDGQVLTLLAQEGEELLIKAPLCAIGQPGETFDLPQQAEQPADAALSAPVAESAAPQTIAEIEQVRTQEGRLFASPRARSLAGRTGAPLELAHPSGPEGRVIERDVQALLNNPSAIHLAAVKTEAPPSQAGVSSAAYEETPISRIRKTIAANMHKSLSEMAQLTLTASFDASEILALRAKLKASDDPVLAKISLNDMILFAVSQTLLSFPDANAHFTGDAMRYFSQVNLGMAVDTPRGLMVPVLFGADAMSLTELSCAAKQVAAQCADGTLPPDRMENGTFTVTNLGALGVESFTPVINPPQTAILGVNTLVTRVRDVQGAAVPYPSMPLSLTFDHRAMDGAPAARLLQAIGRNLEQFTFLLAR